MHDAYLKSLKLWPRAYGRLYRSSGTVHPAGSPYYQQYVERAGLITPERLALSTGASILVAPHFYGAGLLRCYKEQNPNTFAAVVLMATSPTR